jgi:ribose 5-phosphate isomerase B
MKIFIASDHAGVELKQAVINYLKSLKHEVVNLGTDSADSVDYPDYANKLALELKQDDLGVLICGSGVGVSIAANRHKHIRAALCATTKTAELSRQHNNANVLCLGARVTDEKTALEIVQKFFTTSFEGGRHQKRVEKLG